MMSWFVAKMKSRDGRGKALSDYDITKGEDYCRLKINTGSCEWTIFKQRSTVREMIDEKSDFAALRDYTDDAVKAYMQSGESDSLPIFAFYGVDRAVTSIPQKLHGKKSMTPLDVFGEDIGDHVDFRYFFEWFRDREDIENAEYRNGGTFKPDRQLKAVRQAIHTILPEYGELKVHRGPQYFSMTKDGREFRIERFSDGEKCYITLFGDIARKLAMANPAMEDPLKGQGIIVIDEIDLHLHPSWQMKVLGQLKSTFPNCQFFISTHSPQVVSSVDASDGDRLSIVRNGEVVISSSKTYGKKTDELLLKEFGLPNVRNEIVQSHIDKVWDMLGEGDYGSDEYNAEIAWLEHHLDATDSEFRHIDLQVAILKKGKV